MRYLRYLCIARTEVVYVCVHYCMCLLKVIVDLISYLIIFANKVYYCL